MLRSEARPPKPEVSRTRTRPEDSPTSRGRWPSFDWKGWIALAWVLWFGLSYGRMVITQRSDKISSLVARLMK